jgi:STE24 endopeptidase
VAVDLEATVPEVRRYHRLKRAGRVGALLIRLAFLALMALLAGPLLGRTLHPVFGGNRWLELLVLGTGYLECLFLLSLPLNYWSGYVLEHRHRLSTLTSSRWVLRQLKINHLVTLPLNLMLLLGLYASLWHCGRWWWVWASTAVVAFAAVGISHLVPLLLWPFLYKVSRLNDPDLLERLRPLAEGVGLHVEGLYRLHLSAVTRKANAVVAGVGRNRRVFLGDTLLAQLTPEEIEVVFAHEVGHLAHRHFPKILLGSALLVAAGLCLCDLTLRHTAEPLGYGLGAGSAYQEPAALPLLGLVLTVVHLVLGPCFLALCRSFECQADRYALERTRRPETFRSKVLKIARINKSELDPSPFAVWLFYDHPTPRQRLALADGRTGPRAAP